MTLNEIIQELYWIKTGTVLNPEAYKALDVAIHALKKEPTYEQVKEYCRKRCMSIVDNLFLYKFTQPEIIHCAECKWLQCNMRQDGTLPKGVDVFECRHWCGYCDPMDFCSHAERRTN